MVKNLREGLIVDLDMPSLQDYSGNGNDGTNNGTTLTTDQLGRAGRARSFNGTSNYIDTNLILSSDDISISFWMKSKENTSGSNRTFMRARKDADDNLYFRIDTDGTITFYNERNDSGGPGGAVNLNNDPVTYDDDVWHYFVFTSERNGTAYLYIDGIEVDSASVVDYPLNLSPQSLIIGYDHNNNDEFFKGSIAEVKLWNRVLSATEVQQLYNNVKGNYQGLFDSCVAYYDFKNDAKDIIGNYDGTVSDATLTTNHLGISNSAYSCDGINDYITIPSGLTGSSGYTISLWYNKTSGDTNQETLIAYRKNSNVLLKCNRVIGDWSLYHGTWSESVVTFTEDVWQHIVIVITSSNYYVYLNGILSDSGSNSPNIDNSGDNTFGSSETHSGNFLKGSIALPIIWNRALSADEAKQLYDLTKTRMIYPYMKRTSLK